MDAFFLTRLLFFLILIGLGGIGGVGGLAGPHIVLQSAGYNVMHENNIQSPEPVSETVRSYFPETWIWELAVVE